MKITIEYNNSEKNNVIELLEYLKKDGYDSKINEFMTKNIDTLKGNVPITEFKNILLHNGINISQLVYIKLEFWCNSNGFSFERKPVRYGNNVKKCVCIS